MPVMAEYSGASYQALACSTLGNSRMTMRLAFQLPSTSRVGAANQVCPTILLDCRWDLLHILLILVRICDLNIGQDVACHIDLLLWLDRDKNTKQPTSQLPSTAAGCAMSHGDTLERNTSCSTTDLNARWCCRFLLRATCLQERNHQPFARRSSSSSIKQFFLS